MVSWFAAARLTVSLFGLLMVNSQTDNPFSPTESAVDLRSQLLFQNPFSLCYLPFAIGSWLVLSIAMTIDAPTEADGHFPFTGFGAILFSVLVMSPVIGFCTSLISSGWVQFRLGNDYSRIVRRSMAFAIGCVAPIATYAGISLLMLFSKSLGDAINWILLPIMLILYLTFGEFVVIFAERQPTAEIAK